LLVLVFVAAYLLLVWSALKLASGAFLSLSSVQADTRSTYALDAGVAYGLGYVRLNGTPCGPVTAPAFVLPYPTPITVNVSISVPASCDPNQSQVYDLVVTASGTSRTLRAEVTQSQQGQGQGGNQWVMAWESFQ
jgi:hypothetical protein